MISGLRGTVCAIALTLAGVTIVAQPAAAGAPSTLPPTGSGVDISYPQCVGKSHVELPPNIPFAIVGLNGGVPSTDNPCFLSEYNSALLLAGQSDQPHASLYVNTANPALNAKWWPADNTTQRGSDVVNPNGTCAHKAGAACAYVYGYSMAQADFRRARTKLTQIPKLWWLDVETSNTWQPDTEANAASLSGMVDYFQSKGLEVGIYGTSHQWKKIAGVTSEASNLAGLRSWLAGGTAAGSPLDCEKPALTLNGWVAMQQYVTHLDNDFSCHQFHAAGAAISPSTPAVMGTALTAEGDDWLPNDVTYRYQWNRDGAPIAGATGVVYTTTMADVGAALTVTITGSTLGYSTTSKASAVVAVLAATA